MANETPLDTEKEHWFIVYWRPAMAWLYMLIMFVDFIFFPFFNMLLPIVLNVFHIEYPYTPWVPYMLNNNANSIHITFGVCIGIISYGRSQERMASLNNNNTQ